MGETVSLEERIEILYNEYYQKERENTKKKISELEKRIGFYKSVTKEAAAKRAMTIKEDYALKKGMYDAAKALLLKDDNFSSLSPEKQAKMIEEKVEDFKKYSGEEDKRFFIDSYRNKRAKLEEARWQKYNSMEGTEETELLAKFESYLDSEAKLKARLHALKDAYESIGLTLPSCFTDDASVRAIHKAAIKEARGIKSVEELNDSEKTFKDKVISNIKESFRVFNEHPVVATEIYMGSLTLGALAAIGIQNLTNYNLPSSLVTFGIVSPVLFGALGTLYTKIANDSDSEGIQNAKRYGIFPIKVEYEKCKKEFYTYDKMLTDKSLSQEGGNYVRK